MLITAYFLFCEGPIYKVDERLSGHFTVDDGTEIIDRHLGSHTHDGVTWHRIYHLGKLFWARNDENGNVLLTWDWVDYLENGARPNEFVLYYKNPVLGTEWNPDGVPIRIDAVGEALEINGVALVCDRYSFLDKNGEIVVSAWVSDGMGVVKMARRIYGTERIYIRDLANSDK